MLNQCVIIFFKMIKPYENTMMLEDLHVDAPLFIMLTEAPEKKEVRW